MTDTVTDTTDTSETSSGRGGKGPRTFKPESTPRQRVLSESLAKAIKKHTGQDVSWRTVWAVRWTMSRWQTDPETKQLREEMDENLKIAKLKERKEKALALLAETDSELEDLLKSSGEEDDESEDIYDDDGETDETGDDDDDEDDIFSESKVSTSF
jgi:phosphopantothenoylcysteine synthetase/decarboxylase